MSRRCTLSRWFALALVLPIFLLSLGVAHAGEQRAFLDLTVNTVQQRQALVVFRSADLLIRVSDLIESGVHGFAGERSMVGGVEFVSLASLKPGITFAYSEEKLALAVTAAPGFFSGTTLKLGDSGRQAVIDRKASSGFLNYSVTSGEAQGYSAFVETGLATHGSLLYSSFDRNPSGRLSRGISTLTIDDPLSVRRTVVGDTFSSTGQLGGTARIAGIGVARAFDVNPYFMRSAAPGVSGTVLTPSTVDIYVNGRLYREEQIAPGAFNLNDIPMTAGTNDTRVVIRDAFGRQQTIDSPYYLAPEMLRRGLVDYSYNLGFKAVTTFADQGVDYGALSFLGRYQLGVSDSFNAGARLETGAGLISGGPVLVLSRPFGMVGFSAAGSGGAGYHGAAASVSYSYTAYRSVSFSASAVMQSRNYANLSLAPLDDRALLDASVSVGFPVTRGTNLSLRYAATNYRDTGHQGGLFLNGDMQLGPRTSLFVLASRSRLTNGVGTSVFTGINYRLGDRSSGYVSVDKSPTGTTNAFEIQHPAPVGPGFGYRVGTSSGTAGQAIDGVARYQAPYGEYEMRLDRSAAGNAATAFSAAGGIAAIGGTVLATRPILDSFALVDAGVSNVRTYLNNQDIGRTNRKGEILVPGLLPYLDNQLSIAAEDTPMNYIVESSRRVVSPTYRGGTLVRFPVRRYQAYIGRIVLDMDGKTIIPSYGALRLIPIARSPDLGTSTDLGESGEFYLETIAPGRYQAEVSDSKSTCHFIFSAPSTDAPITKLGIMRCATAAIPK